MIYYTHMEQRILPKKHHHLIYKRYSHILVLCGLILTPFIFFVVFSQALHISTPILLGDIGVSLIRLSVAYVISVVLGWVLAVLFYRGRASSIALPFFDVLQSIPTFAALPFVTLIWGKTNTTIIFFLVLAIIWPVFFSILSTLKTIKSDYHEVVDLYRLRGWKRIRYFLFPASVPGIITGSIVGLGDAWEALIAMEIIVHMHYGLGSFFDHYSTDTRATFFGMLGLLLIVFIINKLVWLPLLEHSNSLNE